MRPESIAPFGARVVAAQVTREQAVVSMLALRSGADYAEELRQWSAAADLAAQYANAHITAEHIYQTSRLEPAMRGEEPRDIVAAAADLLGPGSEQ